jgi:glutamyl-tRNA reductase
MTVFALGLNHATAPLALRERLAIASNALQAKLTDLHGHLQAAQPFGNTEAALLSTCNRTELYVAGPSKLVEPALDWLTHAADLPLETLRAHSYTHFDNEAARHAFRVAAGLDSMVLGEPQILGQFKDAAKPAKPARWAPRFTSCFSAALPWPKKCGPAQRLASTPSAWPQPPCGWQPSCSKTFIR